MWKNYFVEKIFICSADFTHNITDGLAIASSFYASPTVGATTTMAVFFHEVPHEVGDFALLIQSGFSRRAAMGAQFITALGALLGTLIGIAVQEMGKGSSSSSLPLGHVHSHHHHHHHHHASSGSGSSSTSASSSPASGLHAGLCGTSLRWGDTLLPFTAGTFLYVATVAVIPELLESGDSSARSSKAREFRKMGMQFAAMALGAAIMLV